MLKRVVCLLLIAVVLLIGMVGCKRVEDMTVSELEKPIDWDILIMFLMLGVAVSCAIDSINFYVSGGKSKKKTYLIRGVTVTIIVFLICTLLYIHEEKAKKERLESLTTCERYGHKYASVTDQEVLIESYNIRDYVDREFYYEANVSGNVSGSGGGFGLIWGTGIHGEFSGDLTNQKLFLVLANVTNRDEEEIRFTVENTKLVSLKEGEGPHAEIWTRYNGWKKCSVCGKETFISQETFYRIYVSEEVINALYQN